MTPALNVADNVRERESLRKMSLIDPTQKEIMEEQKAFLKGKSLKYKLSYFAEYYLKGTIVAIIILICLISLVRTMMNNKDHDLYVLFINSVGNLEASEFEDIAGTNKDKSEIVFDDSLYIDLSANDNASYLSLQKWVALMAAGDCDVMLADFPTMSNYASQGFYMDLREAFSPEELNALGDRVIWSDIYDEDGNPTGETYPSMIDVTDSARLNSVPVFLLDKVVFTIAASTERLDTAKLFFDYINN